MTALFVQVLKIRNPPIDSPSISRTIFLTVLKVIYGSINDDLIWLVVLPVYALWGCRRACGSWVFSEDMELEHWPEMGRAQEKNIYQQ